MDEGILYNWEYWFYSMLMTGPTYAKTLPKEE